MIPIDNVVESEATPNSSADRLEKNAAYLWQAVSWLRLRLQQLAGEDVDGEAIAQARAAMADLVAEPPLPILVEMGRQFGLSSVEEGVLLLCVAMEMDPAVAAWCARAQSPQELPYPTFALALAIFDEPAWDAMLPGRPLRYWRLIEIDDRGHLPLLTSALRGDERAIGHIRGLDYLDGRLANLVVPVKEASEGALPPSQEALVGRVLRHFQGDRSRQEVPLLQLVGADSASKRLVAGRIAAELGVQLYRLPVELLPVPIVELETFLRLWERESIFLPVGLYVDAREEDREKQAAPLARFLSQFRGVLLLDVAAPKTEVERASVAFEVAKPTRWEQEQVWAAYLEEAGLPESPQLLAGQFNLPLAEIARNAGVVRSGAAAEEGPEELHQRLWQACLASTRPQLENLAQRIEAKATWEDIVLPDEVMGLLRQIANQMQRRRQVYEEWGFLQRLNRGLGISAMFAGPSGTGKTMAAEVIASSLQMNLYRIDLSAVVSKYIGETEKNLRKLFDAAEEGGAILFFDEADALFGKRTEVRDSKDRHANIETNYLLQRLESYGGLAILATNAKQALDDAFMRRLRFIVDFPAPGRIQRRRLWEKAFPRATPTEGLDYERMGQWNLTGGSIANIALNAAFLAAEAQTPVTMEQVLAAAKVEYKKTGQPASELTMPVRDRERSD